MRTDVVVVPTPGFDHDPRLGAAAEPFEAPALVAELAVEALVVAVLPGFAGVNQRRFDALLAQPLEDGVTDEFWPVVRAQVTRGAALADQARCPSAGNAGRRAR